MTRSIAEAMQRMKKGRWTTTAPDNPRQGAQKTAHGQRPLRGAAQVLLFCISEPELSLAVFV